MGAYKIKIGNNEAQKNEAVKELNKNLEKSCFTSYKIVSEGAIFQDYYLKFETTNLSAIKKIREIFFALGNDAKLQKIKKLSPCKNSKMATRKKATKKAAPKKAAAKKPTAKQLAARKAFAAMAKARAKKSASKKTNIKKATKMAKAKKATPKKKVVAKKVVKNVCAVSLGKKGGQTTKRKKVGIFAPTYKRKKTAKKKK